VSGSRTIIADAVRLGNVHPGDVLREDFLIGSEISVAEVVERAAIPIERMTDLLAGRVPVDAETDLRLARYLGVSEGLFLRLQNAYDLEEATRDHAAELARIQPRVYKAA